ncbi:hypothetical protein PQY67_04745 [Pseudomonadales bacterium]|jgi:hypothetical protein|nr:hypothetical protein [Pseudomonadota bacterium]MDA7753921.1 hypothetical protein [Pseudomonadales bacterium]MDC0938998.1 hypothetical protein [Pseudomonadales bacterium]MDC6449474.1 hypothetical protein [Pseudomonadales bacterium]
MDLENSDGTGKLKVTRVSIDAGSASMDFEGQVEGYGTVFATHLLTPLNGDQARGTSSGEARTFLLDGSSLSTPHQGTYKRNGSSLQIYFTDAVDNGAVNFVMWDVNILSKDVDVKYWEINPAS